jgi:hypothetical protein
VSVVAVGYAGEPEQLSDELAKRERAARERLDAEDLFFTETWREPPG